MQRTHVVFDILEISFKIYQNKKFPIASLIEEYPIFSVEQPFDKYQFQAIQKKRDQITKISEIFSETGFTNGFDISKLKKLLSIIQSAKMSPNKLYFFAVFALNQYISFILMYEKTNSIQNIDILFSVLSKFSNLDFQSIINESIRDLLKLISNNMTKNLFNETFTPISDYFLCDETHQNLKFDDKKTFSLIPYFLKNVYELEDFENSKASVQISSFLSILLMNYSKYFSQEVFAEIFNVIKPHLDNMSKSAIVIMRDLINYIDKETLSTHFRNLPKKFEKIVEKEEEPYVQSPIFLIKDDSKSSSTKYKSSITINPSQSPECLFRFSNVYSFVNGLDLEKNPCDYLPKTDNYKNIIKIFSPKYFCLIDLISKSLIQSVKKYEEESQIFVDSFSKFIDEEKQGSKYEFDYICILIFYWISLDIRHIKLPNNLLNPITSLKIERIVENDENKKLVYYTINYLTLMKILQNGESCFNSILANYVKYPHFLAELFEICYMQIKNLSAMISQHTWIVRTFRLISLQLQTSEFNYLTPDLDENELNENKTIKNANNDFFIEVIEEARLSIFRLFSELFQYNSFLKLFLSDFLFLAFFLSLLFEINIRQFALFQLQKYLKCNISKENLNKFNFQLTQMINQIYPSLNDNKEGLILIEDVIKMMNSVKSYISNNIDQIQPFCQALTATFDFLDNSEHSRHIFYEIISLFTLVPEIQLDSIEKPLKKFGKINKDEYQLLLNLLASRDSVDSTSEFEIKNSNLMNILFRVFINHSEVDIIELSTRLCKHSHKNCFILHHCKYDILILDYVLKHRNDEEGSESLVHIPSILNNVVLISSVVSSPAVVRKFISLFIPIDNRYISTIHHLLLKPLKLILERAQEIPWSTFSLSQTYKHPINSMKLQLDDDSFSFTCWIYFEGVAHNSKQNEKINILTLLNSEEKPFFNFSIIGNVFYIQDKGTNIQMEKKIWEFVSIIYNNKKVHLFIEDQEMCEINVDVNFPFGLVTVCIGGINSISISDLEKNNLTQNNDNNNFVAQICNINLFSKHVPQLIEIIYRLGPRVTQKKYNSLLSFNMPKIAGYSTHAQSRNFADILLRFFKVEILLPFFAQIDLKIVNGKPSNFKIIDVVSVFKEALSAGEEEQKEFCKKHGFSIISHLLMFASPKQITYELYLKFYEIYEILLSEDIKKNMFINILINFDIWIVAEHQDHMLILVHWRKLIPSNDAFFIEFFKFSRLLEIMRTYYWYSPIEKEKIIGEPQICKVDDNNNKNLHRSRNPNLIISDIRSMLFTILYEISKLQFLDDDFSTLMDHCINIRDKKQRYDLLDFMNTIANADFYPFQQIKNTLQTLSRISILLHSDDKKIISTVLNIICSVYLHSGKQLYETLSLDQNLEAVMKNIEISSMNIDLLNELLILINQKIYNLFPVCSYVSYVIGEIKLYQDINPSQNFVVSPNWAIWSVCEALNQNDLHSSFTIFQFLVCCSHKEWNNIYDTIEIVGQAMKMDEITIDQYKTTFLKVVCLCILNTETSIPSNVFDSLFALLEQHIFFRTKDDNNEFSRAIESLYKKSPFYSKDEQYLDQLNEKMNEFSSDKNDFLLSQEEFLKLELVNHTYKFGFNINENLTWADKDIAQQILMLVTKFREKTKDCIGFTIIIAAFLCHVCFEFVKAQLSEIQLTEKEISDFSSQIGFLHAKLIGLFAKDDEKLFEDDPDMEFLMKRQLSITDIMPNASKILDDLENINKEAENSYVKLFNTYVNYINESTNKMSLIEGKANLSIKNQSGMSSDTDFSSHFNEESSTDKENSSFNSKIESSDDVEADENFFDHEEENDSENDKNIQFSKIDLCEEIRDRMEINSKRWKTLWSNLVMDGAPWDSSLISGKPTVIRWKRDNTLCRYFCPFKMKRNQRPNNHIDASFVRDAGCFSAATKLLEFHNQKLHEEYLKSAPPILLEINQPSSLNSSACLLKPIKSQSSFQPRSPGSLKRKKKLRSQSIRLISPESSRSNLNTNFSIRSKKSRSRLRKTFSFECEYLKIRGLKHGKLVFSNDKIHFIEEDEGNDEMSHKARVINLREITHVFMRNRFHIKSAIEIFLLNGKSYLFNFPNNKSRDIINKIAISIQQLDNSTPDSNQFSTLKQPVLQNDESPRFFKSQKFTEDWVSRKMSNFEYLMKLNIYSERTFNDASQYPFFPWVLSNYESEMIDLKDPNNFRDLSKPIGAVNEDRLNELLQRMNDMSFFAGSSFLYSSFAICPLSVYLWFVRIEPFTTLHIMMQSNKFDHPSRLFSSIPTSYKLVTSHLNDYRELPPEFFFMPEFLFNDNGFDLGVNRGRKINDVILPRWAFHDEEKAKSAEEEKSKQKSNDKQSTNEKTNDADEKTSDNINAEQQINENEEGNDKNKENELNKKEESKKANENENENEEGNDKNKENELNKKEESKKANENENEEGNDKNKDNEQLNKKEESKKANENENDQEEKCEPGPTYSFSSGAECVYMFRKALESDEVSLHLNEWIDLFWGFKQRGEEAKKALNLYNPKMYDSAWTPQTLKDPQKRAEIESMMCHIGQIPPQMFTEPHPKREVPTTNSVQEALQSTLTNLPIKNIANAFIYTEKDGSLIFCLFCDNDVQDESNKIKKKRFVYQASYSFDSQNVTNIRKSEIKNEVVCINFQSSLSQIITAQSTGKLANFVQSSKDQNLLEPMFLIPELSNASQFATSGEFVAVVSDDATLNLYQFGINRNDYKVEFYGDQITCCDVSQTFSVAACGTVSGRIVLCSLFEGKKVCVIPLINDAFVALKIEINDLKPVKMLITDAWGFILTYCEATDASGHKKLLLFLHNVNGHLIRCADVGQFPISCWSSFRSRKDFDYIVMANSKGMVFVFEAFYLNFDVPLFKCYNRVVAVGCSVENDSIVALKEDGNVIVSSICID